MKTFEAREIMSSGRARVDVRLDGIEIVTFYPEHGAWLWLDFQRKVKADGDVLILRDPYGGGHQIS